jgi:hypothetical protein
MAGSGGSNGSLLVVSEKETLEIDINTRIIGTDDPVHVLFPGEAHSLYSFMSRRNVVALDLPGFRWDGRIRNFGAIDQLKERLALSSDLKSWRLSGSKRQTEPSRKLGDYSGRRMSENRQLLLGAIERLYFSLPKGSLVVVPGPGNFSDVLIGQIVDERASFAKCDEYGGEEIPVRRVQWLAKKPKHRFSNELIARLGLPNYLILLDKSLHDEVYRSTFDNYVHNGIFVSKFHTTMHAFTTLDEFHIQSFLNLVAGAYAAAAEAKDKNEEVAKHSLSFEDAIAILARNEDLIPNLTSNINSPGNQAVIHDHLIPLLIAAAVGVAVYCTPNAAFANVKVVNTAAPPGDTCAINVDKSVRDTFTLVGYDDWLKQCNRLKGASDRTGFRPAVRVKVLPSKPAKNARP